MDNSEEKAIDLKSEEKSEITSKQQQNNMNRTLNSDLRSKDNENESNDVVFLVQNQAVQINANTSVSNSENRPTFHTPEIKV